jgi:hypothetical protein
MVLLTLALPHSCFLTGFLGGLFQTLLLQVNISLPVLSRDGAHKPIHFAYPYFGILMELI